MVVKGDGQSLWMDPLDVCRGQNLSLIWVVVGQMPLIRAL